MFSNDNFLFQKQFFIDGQPIFIEESDIVDEKIYITTKTPVKNIKMIEIKPDNQISYPNNFRNILNSKYFIFTSVITSIFIYKKGFSVMKNFYKKYSQHIHKIHQTKK